MFIHSRRIFICSCRYRLLSVSLFFKLKLKSTLTTARSNKSDTPRLLLSPNHGHPKKCTCMLKGSPHGGTAFLQITSDTGANSNLPRVWNRRRFFQQLFVAICAFLHRLASCSESAFLPLRICTVPSVASILILPAYVGLCQFITRSTHIVGDKQLTLHQMDHNYHC